MLHFSFDKKPSKTLIVKRKHSILDYETSDFLNTGFDTMSIPSLYPVYAKYIPSILSQHSKILTKDSIITLLAPLAIGHELNAHCKNLRAFK